MTHNTEWHSALVAVRQWNCAVRLNYASGCKGSQTCTPFKVLVVGCTVLKLVLLIESTTAKIWHELTSWLLG